jgi:hypothetical protein
LIPLVFPFVVKAIEPLGWRRTQYGFVVALAALSTKSWLVIKGKFHDNAFLYPDQLYLMHLGPFISTQMYLVHLAAVVGAALAMYHLCFQGRAGRMLSDEAAGRSVIRIPAPRYASSHLAREGGDEAWHAAS